MAGHGDPETYPGGTAGFMQYGSIPQGREPLEPLDELAEDIENVGGLAADKATEAVDIFGQHVRRAYKRPDIYVDKATDGLEAFGNSVLNLAAPLRPKPMLQPRRRRLSIFPFVLCFILPYTLFAVVFFVMSFSIRFNQPLLCFGIVGGGLFLVLVAGCAARMNRRGNDPSLLSFLFWTSLLGWVLAVVGGEANYSATSRKFLTMQSLSTYHSVDPARMRGQQLMDAGIVQFSNNSRLDIGMSMHFRNAEMYCVAPVTSGQEKLVQYDFWIVGKGCCTPRSGSFHCDGVGSSHIAGGARLMNDAERTYYRLAVQQAEAKFGIKADHPLFFTPETQDLDSKAEQSGADSNFWFLSGLFLFFVFHAVQTVVAAMAYASSIS